MKTNLKTARYSYLHKASAKLSSALVIAALALVPSLIHAQEKVEFTVSLFTPPPTALNKTFRKIQEQLAAESDGRITLNLFEASQMGPPARQFDLVRTGVADMSIMLLGLAPGRFPMLELMDMAGVVDAETSIDSAGPASAAALELADKYLTKELAGVKLLNLTMVPNPVVTTRKAVTKLSDLEGLKIRYPGPAFADLFAELGAVPVALQSNEMAEALARGTVDGVCVGYTGVAAFKILDSAKYILEMPTGSLTFAVVMNQAAYDRLPADLRPIFDRHFGAEGQKVWGQVLARAEIATRARLMDAGAEITALSEEDQTKMVEIAQELRDKAIATREAKGLPAAEFMREIKEVGNKYR